MSINPALLRLSCFACSTTHDPSRLQSICRSCGLPLRADYDLAGTGIDPHLLHGRVSSLWRYREVLPLDPESAVTLYEGWTPLVQIGERLWIKDEARNPTGSFKARGMSVAVSMARALGARALAAPSAGNAAGALAAYGAAARLPVLVVMPEDTPSPFVEECRLYGADVKLVPGTIADAGRWLREHGPSESFDLSTLREPYRVEGKKTMAYELYEQFEGRLPDVIIYPTGGGTGLVGMWKGFDEMQTLGWIDSERPRLVCVQAAGCAPVVAAFDTGAEKTEPWSEPRTAALGLRVPSPIAGFVCLRALRETRGTALAVAEEEIKPATRECASLSGLDICPEAGAAWAALHRLQAVGWITSGDRTVVFNTGTGLKYR